MVRVVILNRNRKGINMMKIVDILLRVAEFIMDRNDMKKEKQNDRKIKQTELDKTKRDSILADINRIAVKLQNSNDNKSKSNT